jgi:hypothetical protein
MTTCLPRRTGSPPYPQNTGADVGLQALAVAAAVVDLSVKRDIAIEVEV